MAIGGGVEDDPELRILGEKLGDAEEREELVEAGGGEVEEVGDVLLVEEGAASRDLCEGRVMGPLEGAEGQASVDLVDREVGGGSLSGERVGERVGRIDREERDRMLRVNPGPGVGEGSSEDRLADPSATAEEDESPLDGAQRGVPFDRRGVR